ncbi:MAG: hypothetical protein ACR2OH_01770 [Microthrixaceae bacterium]
MTDEEPEAVRQRAGLRDAESQGTESQGTEKLGADWWAPRWKGQPGRLEVWYATATDAETGTGLWVHGETVARTGEATAGPSGVDSSDASSSETGASEGAAPRDAAVVSHGWVALFPADGEPVWQRTAMHDGATTAGADDPHPGFCAEDLTIDATGSRGQTGDLSWDLSWDASGQRGLATFPKWAWERELLPGAQVLPAPSLEVSGTVSHGITDFSINGHGQVARIYGHGSAERWGWLHADLGDGNVIELVTAVSRRKGLSRLKAITFLRMRVDGLDWPSTRIASWGLRANLGLPEWSVKGRTQGVEVSIEVTQPNDRNVTIDYTDPDGATATCTNTERADLKVHLRTQSGVERRWDIEGTAHAEIGRRP